MDLTFRNASILVGVGKSWILLGRWALETLKILNLILIAQELMT